MNSITDHYLGHFMINGRKLPGVVSLKGWESRLEVFDDNIIHLPEEKRHTIRGVARSGEKLTICDATGAETAGTNFYYGTTKHFLNLFPHFVAIGPRHLSTHNKVIAELLFSTSGALNLFYDIGAFGSAFNKTRVVKKLMPNWARNDRRSINSTNVFYYADRGPIVDVQLNDMHVQVFNDPTLHFPSPRGIDVRNRIRISLAFNKPLKLQDALRAAYEFGYFCDVISQTKHCIRDIEVRHTSAKVNESFIQLIATNEETDEGARIDFRDHLVSGGLHRQEFETIFARWMKGERDHRSARRRIVECIRYGNHYTADRLVGAANAFDLLPDETVGRPSLPIGVQKALPRLKHEASALPQPYREQVLANIGRIKGANLRQKIIARFNALPPVLRRHFPEIELVIDHAVRTRNYFVHGTVPKLPVGRTYELMFFFTDTLEFIFVAAELYSCGWKYARWLKESEMGRFSEYLRSYDLPLAELKLADGARVGQQA
jgi:hypothetical protein